MSSTTSSLGSFGIYISGGPSNKNKTKEAHASPPPTSTIIPSQLNSETDLQFQQKLPNSKNDKNKLVIRYPSSIHPSSIYVVKEYYD